MKFYIFLIISRRFRHQSKQFLIKKCWRSMRRLCNLIPTAPRDNQVHPENVQEDVSPIESIEIN